MSEENSYRQILRSSSIIGSASVINVAVGLFRIKVAAVLLGPAGIGLIGLLSSLAGTAAAIAGLGFGTVGTRQIAEVSARNDPVGLTEVRRALFWATLALALAGATVFWLLRGVLAVRVLGEPLLSGEIGWMALVVALTVASASQTALLTGMRRIGDLARISVLSTLSATLLGVGALLLWRRDGLVAFLIVTPLVTFLCGHYFVRRLPKMQAMKTSISVLANRWRSLATIGAAFMVAGLAVPAGQLLIRTLLQRHLGPDELGYYQAASTISMTYIGFVLTAMGTDYYPRLTGAIHDHNAANRMVNEQTEVGLLLAGPVFLVIIGLAPFIIELLYSPRFYPAANVLRWMVVGDVLKVVSWPLGFIILAAGNGRTFLVTEFLGMGALITITWIGLPWIGVTASGVAFFLAYGIYMLCVFLLARRRTGFKWWPAVRQYTAWLMLAVAMVFVIAEQSRLAGVVAGLFLSLVFGLFGIARLASKVNLPGRWGCLSRISRDWLAKGGASRGCD